MPKAYLGFIDTIGEVISTGHVQHNAGAYKDKLAIVGTVRTTS